MSERINNAEQFEEEQDTDSKNQIVFTSREELEAFVNEHFYNAHTLDEIKSLRELILSFGGEMPWDTRTGSGMLLEAALLYICLHTTRQQRTLRNLFLVVESMECGNEDESTFSCLMSRTADRLKESGNEMMTRLALDYSLIIKMSKDLYLECIISTKLLLADMIDLGEIIPSHFYKPLTQGEEFSLEADRDIRKTDGERGAGKRGHGKTPPEIKRYLDMHVIGQHEIKRVLAVSMHRHLLAKKRAESGNGDNVMLIGRTGSGKTLLAKTLAQASGLPYMVIDASSITQDGWHGLNREDVLAQYFSLQHSQEDLEYGIIIFDEFDKVVNAGHSAHGDNVGYAQQSVFLSMMDGTPIVHSRTGQTFHTENMMFIFTGAFTEIDRKYEKESKHIGFGNAQEEGRDQFAYHELREDLIASGVIPEFAGRINTVVRVRELDAEQACEAVLMENGTIMRRVGQLKREGIKTTIDKEYIKKCVSRSLELGLGIRGCVNMLDDEIKRKTYEAYEDGADSIHLADKKQKPRPKAVETEPARTR